MAKRMCSFSLIYFLSSWSAEYPKMEFDFFITKPSRDQFEAQVFNQEKLLYCTYSIYRLTFEIPEKY
jgi:hypothetical protein